MYLYSGLFESMMECCGRCGLRRGPVYTLTMMVLGLAVSLNLLTVAQLPWRLGFLGNPYGSGADAHAQRWILGALYVGLLANLALARLKFRADRKSPPLAVRYGPPATASFYVLASASLFVITLALCLHAAGEATARP
ncbi:MAG TPA: hypothetical protein VMF03_01040 [Steroidobacteraceae bacterium]|nr:hypothetical protein [Steroidobacteraceae bacterium]